MAFSLNIPMTVYGVPAPAAYAEIQSMTTEVDSTMRVVFVVWFSLAAKEAQAAPITYEQCVIPQAYFEQAGGLYPLAYQWAKANMPYFTDAVDA